MNNFEGKDIRAVLEREIYQDDLQGKLDMDYAKAYRRVLRPVKRDKMLSRIKLLTHALVCPLLSRV